MEYRSRVGCLTPSLREINPRIYTLIRVFYLLFPFPRIKVKSSKPINGLIPKNREHTSRHSLAHVAPAEARHQHGVPCHRDTSEQQHPPPSIGDAFSYGKHVMPPLRVE